MTYISPVPITHSSISGNVPDTAGELSPGALAVNVADGAMYTKDYTGKIVRVEGDIGNGSTASAATVDLGSVMGAVIEVTGTTAITAINLRPGQTRTVRFSGALTLTHGANLVLPGAQNITTQAGEIAVFRGFAGGVVRCTNYTFASRFVVWGHLTVEGVTSTGSTGAGHLVFASSPTLTAPNLGTPTALVATNASGTATALTAGNSQKLEGHDASYFATAAALAALAATVASIPTSYTHSHSFSGTVSGASCSGTTSFEL